MIQVIQRALNVLAHLGRNGDTPCILGDIARATGLNPATCARILGTLMSEGYVEQEGRRKGYRLGPMAYALTAAGPYRKDLLRGAEPVVRQLAADTRETALVAILHQDRRYTLCQVDGTHDVQVRSDAVRRGDIYSTATGRLLLAHLPDEARGELLRRAGLPGADAWPEARTRRALDAHLDAIRAMDILVNTTPTGLVGLACPLREADRIVAALGLYLPASRFTGTAKATILEAMKEAARQINRRLDNLRAPHRTEA